MAHAQTAQRGGSMASFGEEEVAPPVKKRGRRVATAKGDMAARLQKRLGIDAKRKRLFGWFEPTEEGFVTLYKASALTQIEWVKSGIGAKDAKVILDQLRVPKGEALIALKIPVATVNRKAKTNAFLATAEGERVLGIGRLLGQIQTMVQESGSADGFDASAWLSMWMSTPLPALGGTRPLDLMDTMTGQTMISQMLSQMQSGAYA